MRDSFSGVHPAVGFLFFTLVLLFTMFLLHPVFLLLSLAGAISYAVYLNGKKAARLLLLLLPLLLLTAGIGAAFNHEGVTILGYFRNGNPLTLESIAAGLSAAVMLVAAVCWFSCYSAVMTTDKFLYLFGRVIPALSLLLSMTLRFVPRLRVQGKIIADAQHSIGRGTKDGRLPRRAANGLRILSILTTWALENAVETADSMKSRGYGLPGRTAGSLYRFDVGTADCYWPSLSAAAIFSPAPCWAGCITASTPLWARWARTPTPSACILPISCFALPRLSSICVRTENGKLFDPKSEFYLSRPGGKGRRRSLLFRRPG
jgi:energy-coupling factor transport system permease protein